MNNIDIKFNIPLFFLKEKKSFIAYSPALDLSTSGKSFREAQKRFSEISTIFFQEIIKKGTIKEVLEGLGWEKVKDKWSPPFLISHTQKDIEIPVYV